ARELRLRSHSARNWRIPRGAASGIRLGATSARSLHVGQESSRRRHLRRGAQKRTGARALSRLAVRMSAAYQIGESHVAEAGAVHVEFSVRNESREPWRAADQTAISYHVYDAETGTLLSDGPRVPIARDLGPGETFPVKLDLEVPAGDGRYR